MDNTSFINRYGLTTSADKNSAAERSRTYIIVKKEDNLLCLYDTVYGLYKFPNSQDVTINDEPTLEFTLHTGIAEQGHYILETQLYKVYEVENVYIEGENFGWCAINDIMVSNIPFDATQKYGFKNLIVRVKR